mmetsp:Transcript_4269/g.13212  ORF Transcript_4269/g.13212 Transcript_4269/m.13212 type:complete len:159 (+) Transcript_4269:1-477(+)
MDWVLHGNDYAPCFGTANHHLIDAVARSPSDTAAARALRLAAATPPALMYVTLFEKAEGFFGEDDTFLGGESNLTVADIPLAVELNRFNQAVAVLRHEGASELGLPALPRLRRWYAQCLELPAFQEAVVENEMRHHQIEEGSELEKAVRTGLVGPPST